MKGTPIFDDVLVELEVDEDTVTEGGILLPKYEEEGKETPTTGKVVAVGPGLPREMGAGYYPMPVKEGDIVMLKEPSGFSFMYNGKPAVLLNVREILLVVEEK